MEAANTPKHPTDAEGKYLNSLCVNDEADREVISRGWGGGGVLSIGIHVIGKCMYAWKEEETGYFEGNRGRKQKSRETRQGEEEEKADG